MKFKNIKFIISLNSIALFGVIIIQVLWMNAALKLSETNLDRDVNEALNRVAEKIDNSEKFRKIIQKLNLQKSTDENELVESIDEVFENMPGTGQSGSEQLDKTDIAQSFNKSLKKFYQRRIQVVDSLVKELMMTDFFTFQSIDERLEGINLDSLIKSELAFKNINTPFEYGIYEKQQLTKIRSKNFDPARVEYKTMLLRYDVMSPPVWLFLYFPKKKSFLYKSVFWLIALTFFLILIIIITFYITVDQMLTQKEISRIKSDFINNMTHEFKTPIATIGLTTDLMSNPKVISDPERLMKYVNKIKEENKRMNQQVEIVLRLAQLDRKQLQLKLENFDLLEVTEEAIHHMKYIIESKNGIIRLINNASNTRIFGDKEHIKNVIINLLDNAIKYSPEILDIQIELFTPKPNEVSIAVKDKGIGMTPEVQKRVFDRFYRQTTGNIHDVKGHGLGLSYVQEIVKLHNGDIKVKSELNKGSIFTVTFKNN
ncbi:sensor histidine kinase [Thermaurantimonas aggregans]|uniref:sensor histidine kinase n=1 Tax=Thermaurantimonas aggregans TaxID=2173829 RepID=UPI0023F11E1C|nr:HAMP domain-containing sensor histidine kinase [Thermaurantimonas aggregans]MCX8149788.1 HAMP domain-containing histidine kinase [Thermaurantimonas aggregans]